MAQITNATLTGSSLANIVNSEKIHNEILDANRTPTPWEALARIYTDTAGTAQYTVTKWVDAAVPLSEASGKAETDQFADTEQTMSQRTITPAVVGIMKSIGDEVLQDTIRGPQIVADLVRESVASMRVQMNSDALSNITAATSSETFLGLPLTRDRFAQAAATFHALNPMLAGRPSWIGSVVQVEDLKADIRAATGAVYGSEFGAMAAQMLEFSAAGYLGPYEGFDMWRSDGVPAYDGSNTASAMLVPNRAIGVAIWWNMRIETGRLEDRLSSQLIVSSRYGSNLVDLDAITELATVST